jgi:hypothetical protein
MASLEIEPATFRLVAWYLNTYASVLKKTSHLSIQFVVLPAVNFYIVGFRVVTPCSLIGGYEHVASTFWLQMCEERNGLHYRGLDTV